MNCKSCQEPADTNTLKCNGSCSNVFHISCLSSKNSHYKNALIGYLSKITNLRWFCDDCVKLLLDTQNQITTEISNRLADIRSFADNLLTTLNPSIWTTQTGIGNTSPTRQNKQTEQNAANLNGSFATAASTTDEMDHSPIPPTPRFHEDGSLFTNSNVNAKSRKRPMNLSPTLGLSPHSKQQKLTGNQPVSLADMIAKPKPTPDAVPKITVKTNMTRSIYVTPFNPSIESTDIMNHLNSIDNLKHIVPNITCTKLMSDKRRIRRLSFVSFKLDVQRHHFDIISDPVIWRTNDKDELTITEFINKRETHEHASTENPFAKSNSKPKQKISHRHANNDNFNGAIHQPKYMANRQQNQRQNFHQKVTNQYHKQRPNFQQHCQKLCCIKPKPQCYRCHDHYVGNPYGHRPPNRR